MSELPYEQQPDLSDDETTSLAAQRAGLLTAVDFSRRWHEHTLSDPKATEQDKRRSRDRKREIIGRLVAFDEQYPGIAPPEEE